MLKLFGKLGYSGKRSIRGTDIQETAVRGNDIRGNDIRGNDIRGTDIRGKVAQPSLNDSLTFPGNPFPGILLPEVHQK